MKKREALTVQTVTGPREVLAWRCGDLAVHRSLAASGFTVTHAPSGLRLRSRIADKTHAFQLAENLLRLPIDWSLEHPFHSGEVRERAWRVCQDVPRWQRRSRAPPGAIPEPDEPFTNQHKKTGKEDETMNASSNQWEEIKGNGSATLKWDKPGTTIEGLFNGGKPAGEKMNILYSVTGEDGHETKFWETMVLKERLSQVQPGQHVRIRYDGVSGKTKLFAVAVRR